MDINEEVLWAAHMPRRGKGEQRSELLAAALRVRHISALLLLL